MARSGFGNRFPARNSAVFKALAANIRRLRKERGWTQDDLAAAAKVEQAAISLMENARANPTLRRRIGGRLRRFVCSGEDAPLQGRIASRRSLNGSAGSEIWMQLNLPANRPQQTSTSVSIDPPCRFLSTACD
jgi:DNA-binding XRE family transcriptional regulator